MFISFTIDESVHNLSLISLFLYGIHMQHASRKLKSMPTFHIVKTEDSGC